MPAPPRPPSESPSSPGGLSSAGLSAAGPEPGPGSGSGPGSWGQTGVGSDVAAAPGPDPPCPSQPRCPSHNLHGSRSVPRRRCPTSARLRPRVHPVPSPASSQLPASLPPGSAPLPPASCPTSSRSCFTSARFQPYFRLFLLRFRPLRAPLPPDSSPASGSVSHSGLVPGPGSVSTAHTTHGHQEPFPLPPRPGGEVFGGSITRVGIPAGLRRIWRDTPRDGPGEGEHGPGVRGKEGGL